MMSVLASPARSCSFNLSECLRDESRFRAEARGSGSGNEEVQVRKFHSSSAVAFDRR